MRIAGAESLNKLAVLYHTQGRYAEAEPLHQRALALREQALGPNHPEVATSLNYLAAVYYSQARRWWQIGTFGINFALWLSVGLLVQVGVHVGRVRGPFHMVSIAIWLVGGLAVLGGRLYSVRFARHSFAKVEALCQRALALPEQALGPQHFQVGESLNNLAAVYLCQGRKAKAKPLCQRALAIWEQVLGPRHPQIAIVRKNYARSQPLRQRIRSWLLCKREPG